MKNQTIIGQLQMNSVSVAAAVPATDTSPGKLPAIDQGAEEPKEGGEVAASTAAVVIIKAESCEEPPVNSGPLQNGGLSSPVAVKGAIVMSSSGGGGGEPKVENGGAAMDSLQSGVAKVAINGTNQNRMIRVSQY